jgi:hypothetical protein
MSAEQINLDHDYLINFTQKERMLLLDDEQTPAFRLKILDSIAVTALGTKRISHDDNNATADRDVAIAMSVVLKSITKNPFLAQQENKANSQQLAPTVPTVIPVPDETLIGLSNLNIEDITD